MEPTRSQNPGHTVGIRRIRAKDVQRTIAKRARTVGFPVVTTSSGLCLPTDPQSSDEARRRNERGHGNALAWSPRCQGPTEHGTLHCVVSDEDGASWTAVCPQFWSSWADAIHMRDQRLPTVSRAIFGQLTGGDAEGCLGALVCHKNLGSGRFQDATTVGPRMLSLASGSTAGNVTRLRDVEVAQTAPTTQTSPSSHAGSSTCPSPPAP